MTVLSVSHLSKRYASYASNLERFAGWFGAPVKPTEEFWPVRDVSFSLAAGEALGLIGQNGAGKSTLLKLITGTVRPTEGTANVGGRISAILELGLGFNPEFTGRQNAYHAGGLMGLSQARLTELMPHIEDFAEIGDFFDRPLRTYSSGMQARLAFALATAERPEVLIVDEVLSVGDSYFQHKSFDRIRSFRAAGTSIILVTHGLGDVRSLCDRVILLDKGHVLKDGPPDEVVDYYNALIATKENAKLTVEQRRSKEGWLHTRSGTFEAHVKEIGLLDAGTRKPIVVATVGQELILRIIVKADIDLPRLVLGIMLRDYTGHIVWGTNTWHTRQVAEDVKVGEEVAFEIAFECRLGAGSYSFSPALTDSDTHLDKNYEWSDNALVFDVMNADRAFFLGTTALEARFNIQRRQGSVGVDRVAMTISCRDTDAIGKVPDAGRIEDSVQGRVQIMHNGLRVVAGGYHGEWMEKIISELRGHHEPQEELMFNALLSHCGSGSLFVELGAFWSYYSLWYLQAIPQSTAICVEPDPQNLEMGRRNAELNGYTDRIRFIQSWIGEKASPSHEAIAESVGRPVTLERLEMASILALSGGRTSEILHIDAQGAELGFLRSMAAVPEAGRPRFLVVSTHHVSISGSSTTHRDCLAEINHQGGKILCEHGVEESFSGDGLIVAAFRLQDHGIVLPRITRNKANASLFGPFVKC